MGGKDILPTCHNYMLSRDGVPAPCRGTVQDKEYCLPPATEPQAGSMILNMGVYKIKYCSEVSDPRCKTLIGDHNDPVECKCTSTDECWHEKGDDLVGPVACERTVTVVDRTAPVITLLGDAEVRDFQAGQEVVYDDPGATAFDSVDGDMVFHQTTCAGFGSKDTCDGTNGFRDTKSQAKECVWLSKLDDTPTTVDTCTQDAANNKPCRQYCVVKPCDFDRAKVLANDPTGITGRPGSICKLVLGADGSVVLNRRAKGKQRFFYIAIDTSGNRATTTRVLELVDEDPPTMAVIGNEACARGPRRLPPDDDSCKPDSVDYPDCRDERCYGIHDVGESTFHVDDLGFAKGAGAALQEVVDAGTAYHDLGALSFDEVDLARTIDGPTVGEKKKAPRTSSGVGPMLANAHVKRDVRSNCQRPNSGPDYFTTGECIGTVRAHNPVNVYPSRRTEPSLPKSYTVYYRSTDASFNSRPAPGESREKYSRTVQIEDKDAPSIDLLGEEEVWIEGGTTDMFDSPINGTSLGSTLEEWVIAHDTIDADLTADIRRSVTRLGSTKCTKKRGCNFAACSSSDPTARLACDLNRVTVYAPVKTGFRITYSVSDRNNNPVSATRKMIIRDTIKPVQFLKGLAREPLEGAEQWEDPGAYAEDLLDDTETLSAKISVRCVNCQELDDLGISHAGDQIDSNVRAFTLYRLEYTVRDDAGNVADRIYRDVEVRDSKPPTLELTRKTDFLDAATTYTEPRVQAEDTLDGEYAFYPRFSSRIRSRVRRADKLCDYSKEYFDETKLRDKGLLGECTAITPKCDFPAQYESQTPTKTVNRVCMPVSSKCAFGPELAVPSLTADRMCYTCPANENGNKTPLLESPVESVEEIGQLSIKTHTINWNPYTAIGTTRITTLRGSTVEWVWSDTDLPLDLVAGTRGPSGADADEQAKNDGFNGVPEARNKNSTQEDLTYSYRFLEVGVHPFYSTAYPLLDGAIVVQAYGQKTHQVSWGGVAGLQQVVMATGDSLTWLWDRRRPTLSLISRASVKTTGVRAVTIVSAAGGLEGTCNLGDVETLSVQIDTGGEPLEAATVKVNFDPAAVAYVSGKHAVNIVTGGGAAIQTKFDVDTSSVSATLTLPAGGTITGTATLPVTIFELKFECKAAGALDTLPTAGKAGVATTEIRRNTLVTQSSGTFHKLFEDEGVFNFESEDGDDLRVVVTSADAAASAEEEVLNRQSGPRMDADATARITLEALQASKATALARDNDGFCHEIALHHLQASLHAFSGQFTSTTTTITATTTTTPGGTPATTSTTTTPTAPDTAPPAYPAVVVFNTLEAQQTEMLGTIISDLEQLIAGVEAALVQSTTTTTETATTTTATATTTTTTNNATQTTPVTTTAGPTTTTTPPRPEFTEVDNVLERIRWLDSQDVSMPRMLAILKAELADATSRFEALRDGSHRIEYSTDGGRSWEGLSARPDVLPSSKAIVFRIPTVESGFGGEGLGSGVNSTGTGSTADPRLSVRFRLSPGRKVSGTAPLFEYRLWNDPLPAGNTVRPAAEFIDLADVKTEAQAALLAVPTTVGTWNTISAVAVMDVDARIAQSGVGVGDVLASELPPTFEIEEDEQYANFPYQLVSDLIRDSVGVPIDVGAKLSSVGLAVVGVGRAGDGVWTYTCGKLNSAAFLPIPRGTSASAALLLQGGCRIRFEPGQDYNSELDLNGIPRPSNDVKPFVTVITWDPQSVEDLDQRFSLKAKCAAPATAGRTGGAVCSAQSSFWELIDTTASRVPGEFGEILHTMSTRIVAAPDNPVFLTASSRRDTVDTYTVKYREGSAPVPVVSLATAVTLVDPDGSQLTDAAIRLENASEYDSLIWPAYEFELLNLQVSVKNEKPFSLQGFVGFGDLVYTITPAPPLTALPTEAFNEAIRLVTYRNTATDPAGGKRTIRFAASAVPTPGEAPRRTEANDPTSGFTVIELDKVNSRPIVVLDQERTTTNGLNWYKYGPSNPANPVVDLVFPRAAIVDDSAAISKLAIRVFRQDSAVGKEVISISDAARTAAEAAGITVTVGNQGKSINAVGLAPATTWSSLLKGVQYSHTNPDSQRSAGSIEVIAYDDTNRASIPARLLMLMFRGNYGNPYVDLNGLDEDGGDVLESAQRVFVEQSEGILLADQLYIDPVGASQMKSARVTVERARNFPYEVVSCDEDEALGQGLKMSVDPGAASVTITGLRPYDKYEQVLRTCTYRNSADEPDTKINRLVEFTVTNDKDQESPSAHVVVRVVSVNDAPTVHQTAAPLAFSVVQGASSKENNGISIADLLGDTPISHSNPAVATAPKFLRKMKLLPCQGTIGCRWTDADQQCSRFGLTLCTQEDAMELWPNNGNIDGIANSGNGGGIALAWTADKTSTDPLSGVGSALLSQSTALHNVTMCSRASKTGGCKVDFGQDANAALVMHGRPGGSEPQFFAVRQSTRNTGQRIDALCCPPNQSEQQQQQGEEATEEQTGGDYADVLEAHKADVWFDAAGISGAVVFSQASAKAAVHVAITLKGLTDALTQKPRVAHMEIRDFPTSSIDESCANGPLFGAENSVCLFEGVCTLGILSEGNAACCPQQCQTCDVESCGKFPNSESKCCPDAIVESDIICAEPSDVGCKSMPEEHPGCIAGSLSSRHSTLNSTVRNNNGNAVGLFTDSYLDAHLTLHGKQSVIGRSLVLYDLGNNPVACGTIGASFVSTIVAPLIVTTIAGSSKTLGSVEVSQSVQPGSSNMAVVRAVFATAPDEGPGTNEGYRWGFATPSTETQNCRFGPDGFSVNLDAVAGLILPSAVRETSTAFTVPKDSVAEWSKVAVAVVSKDQQTTEQVKCSRLGAPRHAVAVINMKGLVGTIEMTQTSPDADVHIRASIASYTLQDFLAKATVAIHEFPVPRPEVIGVDAGDICSIDQIGASRDDIEGLVFPEVLAGEPAVAEVSIPNYLLTLYSFGDAEGAMDRSVVLTATTGETICASLHSKDKHLVATAVFGPPLVNDDKAAARSKLSGDVTFRQVVGDASAPTSIVTDLKYSDDDDISGGNAKHTFVIAALPSLFTCTKEAAALSLFEPDVKVSDRARFLGSVYNRHASLNIRSFVTDQRVALSGFNSVADLYVVVFRGTKPFDDDPIGCAKIELHAPRTVSALFDLDSDLNDAGGVHGRVVLTQMSPDSPTQVDVSFAGGLPLVSSWQISQAAATSAVSPAGEMIWECTGGASLRDSTFNPRSSGANTVALNVPKTTECNADDFRRSVDACKLGDLQGILGSIGGSAAPVERTYMHPNLPLFGPYSVQGHGLLLGAKDGDGLTKPLACSPLAAADVQDVVVAEAVYTIPEDSSIYDGALFGSVTVKQPAGDIKAASTVVVNLGYECARKDHRWALSEESKVITYGPSQKPPQSAIASVQECSRLCSDNAECTEWTWASPEAPADFEAQIATGDCILLKNSGLKMVDNPQPGYISGRRGCEASAAGQKALRHGWTLGNSAECPAAADVPGNSEGSNGGTTTPAAAATTAAPSFDGIYNPQNLPASVEAAGCSVSGRLCSVGNLGGKHGSLTIPTPGPGQMFADLHLPIQGPASVVGKPLTIVFNTVGTGKSSARSTSFCSTLQPRYLQTLRDSDEGDARGIAVIDVDDEYGRWEVKSSSSEERQRRNGNANEQDNADDDAAASTGWIPLLKSDLSLNRALKLGSSSNNRLRFIPNEDFQGKVTCPECPAERKGISCVPCPLNMTGGAVTFVGWDGQGESGTFGDALYKSARGTFSSESKSVAVIVAPARVDSTAPSGAQFKVTFSVEDNVGNSPAEQSRFIEIRDEESPTIVLRSDENGNSNSITHEAATPYVDAGAVAFDNLNGDVTSRIRIVEISSLFRLQGNGSEHGAENCPQATGQRITLPAPGHLSTDVPGGSIYDITMETSDVAGNKASIVRTVNIVDTTPPVLFPRTAVVPLEIATAGERARWRRQQENTDLGENGAVGSASTGGDAGAEHCPLEALYSQDTVADKLKCAWAHDTLDGDLSCHVEINVQRYMLQPSPAAIADGALPYTGFEKDAVVVNGTTCSEFDCSIDPTFGSNGVGTLSDIDAAAPLHTRYLVTYKVFDDANNMGQTRVTVVVADTTPPTLTWTDYDAVKTVAYGSVYGSKERAADVEVVDFQGDTRVSLGRESNHVVPGKEVVNTVVPGTYNISYFVKDVLGNSEVYYRSIKVLPNPFVATPVDCGVGNNCTCGCSTGKDFWQGNVTVLGVAESDFNTIQVHAAFKIALASGLREKGSQLVASGNADNGRGITTSSLDYLYFGSIQRIDTHRRPECGGGSTSTCKSFDVEVTVETNFCDNEYLSVAVPQLAFTNLKNDSTTSLLFRLTELLPSVFTNVGTDKSFISMDAPGRVLPRACAVPVPEVEEVVVLQSTGPSKGGIAAAVIVPLLVLIAIAVVVFIFVKKKRAAMIEEIRREVEEEVKEYGALYSIYGGNKVYEMPIYGEDANRELFQMEDDEPVFVPAVPSRPTIASEGELPVGMQVSDDANAPMLPSKERDDFAVKHVGGGPIAGRAGGKGKSPIAGRTAAAAAPPRPPSKARDAVPNGVMETTFDDAPPRPPSKASQLPDDGDSDDAHDYVNQGTGGNVPPPRPAKPGQSTLPRNVTLRRNVSTEHIYVYPASMDRQDAGDVLVQNGTGPGTFLVRGKDKRPDTRVLSMMIAGGTIEHHMLKPAGDIGTYTINKYTLPTTSLADAIEYMRSPDGAAAAKISNPLTVIVSGANNG